MRGARSRLLLAGLVAALLALAPTASAVVVHRPDGQFLSVALHRGLRAAAIPGSIAARRHAALSSASGTLDYHGGPVLHSSSPYLIFWAPSGESIPPSTTSLLERYFADVAADSGGSANVYAVARQFTDSSGFADYSQTFSTAGQAILDTQPYPARKAGCAEMNASTCLTDAQVQSEIKRLVAADELPTGTGDRAPIYFVVLPADVNECYSGSECADNAFCAYHSNFLDGGQLLYAAIPLLLAASDPKDCQYDGNTAVQQPNGDPVGDVAIKYLSHEDSETITDPLGTGWYSTSGNEDGDNCDFYGTTVDPADGYNPNAFAPALGGSAAAGSLYNQLISGGEYYLQSEWSNGDGDCELRPSAATIAPSFTVPPGQLNAALTFDPGASTAISSETWSFGDGSGPVFHAGGLTPVSHTYTAAGTYTITLTLVDTRGNISSASEPIRVGRDPVASFTFSPGSPAAGSTVGFDGSGSSDPDAGIEVTSYAWDFGDGGSTSGASATASHTYSAAGTYAVTLTATNSAGLTNAITQQVTVSEAPSAAFTARPSDPATGQAVAFHGSASPHPGPAVTYAWNFGDGATGAGADPRHMYRRPGTYRVTLAVVDSRGQMALVAHQIRVERAGITRIRLVHEGATAATIAVTTNAPGKVTAAGRTVRLKRSGTARLTAGVKAGQRLKVRFVPAAGRPSIRTITL
jgi:PKD repeat protein